MQEPHDSFNSDNTTSISYDDYVFSLCVIIHDGFQTLSHKFMGFLTSSSQTTKTPPPPPPRKHQPQTSSFFTSASPDISTSEDVSNSSTPEQDNKTPGYIIRGGTDPGPYFYSIESNNTTNELNDIDSDDDDDDIEVSVTYLTVSVAASYIAQGYRVKDMNSKDITEIAAQKIKADINVNRQIKSSTNTSSLDSQFYASYTPGMGHRVLATRAIYKYSFKK